MKGEPRMILEVIENNEDYILIIYCSVYCPLLFLPKQTCPFIVFLANTSPEHPANSPLPFLCYAVRVEKLWSSNFACALLPVIISWLTPALASTDPISLLVCPTLCFSAQASCSFRLASEIGGFFFLQFCNILPSWKLCGLPSHYSSSLAIEGVL